MSSAVIGFSASHQHRWEREQSIRWNNVHLHPAQLQAFDADASSQAVVPDVKPVPEVHHGTDLQENADPLTLLRARILALLTGQDLFEMKSSTLEMQESPADTSVAPVHKEPTSALVSPDEVFRVKVREQESSFVNMWVSLSLDGEGIEGSFSFALHRSDQWEQSLSLEGVRAFLDPLVLNFTDTLQLSEQRTAFDLNVDGESELIPRFASNSYALARDLNANGRIDDGTEVIGALSGDGFAELAQWDSNSDGLITPADPVWSSLVLWQPGAERMETLATRQVRAIGTNLELTPFTLTQGQGDPLGRIRATGYFVTGDSVRIAQQVDLAV